MSVSGTFCLEMPIGLYSKTLRSQVSKSPYKLIWNLKNENREYNFSYKCGHQRNPYAVWFLCYYISRWALNEEDKDEHH